MERRRLPRIGLGTLLRLLGVVIVGAYAVVLGECIASPTPVTTAVAVLGAFVLILVAVLRTLANRPESRVHAVAERFRQRGRGQTAAEVRVPEPSLAVARPLEDDQGAVAMPASAEPRPAPAAVPPRPAPVEPRPAPATAPPRPAPVEPRTVSDVQPPSEPAPDQDDLERRLERIQEMIEGLTVSPDDLQAPAKVREAPIEEEQAAEAAAPMPQPSSPVDDSLVSRDPEPVAATPEPPHITPPPAVSPQPELTRRRRGGLVGRLRKLAPAETERRPPSRGDTGAGDRR
jgi:hypothetical protein